MNLGLPENHESIDLLNLRFSASGKYLIALTDLPTFEFFIWEVKTGNLLCTSGANGLTDTFFTNPYNDRQFCSGSKEDGTLDFWEIEVGHRKHTLRHLPGSMLQQVKIGQHGTSSTFDHLSSTMRLHPKHFQWIGEGQVLASTAEGVYAVYEPSKGIVHQLAVPKEVQQLFGHQSISELTGGLLLVAKVRNCHFGLDN